MIGDNSVVIIVQERDVTKLEVTSIPVLRLTSRGQLRPNLMGRN